MAEITLHRIRADVLLWALGGFGEQEQPTSVRHFTKEQVRAIARIASKPIANYGEVAELARRMGRSPACISVHVTHFRHGRIAGYAREILR